PSAYDTESDPPKPVPHVALLPGGRKIVAPAPPGKRGEAVKNGDLNGKSAGSAAMEPVPFVIKGSEPTTVEAEPKPEVTTSNNRAIPRTPEYTRKLEPVGKSDSTVANNASTTKSTPSKEAESPLERTTPVTTSKTTPTGHPLQSAKPLTPQLLSLQNKVRRVMTSYFPRRLNSREHDCWETMHAVIAYGLDTDIHRDGPGGKLVNGAGWLCFNGSCANYRLLYVEDGRVMARQGVGVQGHFGQFLAILAQSQMPLSYPMLVEGKEFTVGDLLESEKVTCQSGMELTFKLIAITKYAEDLDERWQNNRDETWSVEKLVKEELAAPIRGAACGGTHRLTGLAYAVRRREQLEQPMDGEFARAKKFLEDYHRYTFSLQNRDGSFSTEWFRGPGSRPDLGRRLQTTGHILEWLVFSLPERDLTDPRVVRAVDYLATIMAANPDREWEIGPLGHAIHALSLYNERVFVAHENEQRELARERLSDRGSNVRRAQVKVDPATGDAIEE
ncbi:MAG: hypothetical protein JNM18_16570, partial [Planctomycetaceae bacterium]|nr:hypothetical protein [Planctomycetaceae bacterium]